MTVKDVKPILAKLEDFAQSAYDSSYEDGIRIAMQVINETPVADVQEVKHGKWLVEDKYTDHKTLRCSECGWIFNRDYIQPKDEYCSHCGAKMDGKENDK